MHSRRCTYPLFLFALCAALLPARCEYLYDPDDAPLDLLVQTFILDPAPEIVSTDPAADATGVSINKTFQISFSESMDLSSLSVQANDGACSRSLQISANNFASCLGGVVNSDDAITYTLRLNSAMNGRTVHAFRITGAALDRGGKPFFQRDISFTTQILAGSSPRLRSTDSGLTVTDDNTGLVWERCSKGQSGANCSGTRDTAASFSAAQSYCDALELAGQSDWRLPEIREWVLLMDYSIVGGQRLNASFFPDESANFLYHSATITPSPPTAWLPEIDDGTTQFGSSNYPVRCTRGANVPPSEFTNRGDGAIADSVYGLLWTRCGLSSSGALANGTDFGCSSPDTLSWVQATQFCANLSFAGRDDWRLPTARELQTLIDFTRTATPLADPSNFPNAFGGSQQYWTSESAQDGINKIVINMDNFSIGEVSAAGPVHARCVTGQDS